MGRFDFRTVLTDAVLVAAPEAYSCHARLIQPAQGTARPSLPIFGYVEASGHKFVSAVVIYCVSFCWERTGFCITVRYLNRITPETQFYGHHSAAIAE
jgi:hypothetical protein